MGLPQHSSPHTGLHVGKADGLYSRGWGSVWMLCPLEVHGSEPRCGPSSAFAASIQSSRKCLLCKRYHFFCKWLITVHPCCPSRVPIGATATKRKLCTKPAGPAWTQQVFIAVAMLTDYLIAWTDTFPQKPVEATETICCTIFPPAARAALWYLEKARPSRRDFDLKQQLVI